MNDSMAQRSREVEDLLRNVATWAAGQSLVHAVLLVGSWARGAASLQSDLDLIILSDTPGEFIEHDGWWLFARDAILIRKQAWGIVQERRLRLASTLEVELDIALTSWLRTPLDPGTRAVLSDGVRALYDPDSLLEGAMLEVGA
jgi:predicted nucleotidyltransferase